MEREELELPDGDRLELHSVTAPTGAPRLLLLHGLEGAASSHYVGGILAEAAAEGWGATLMVFRGCGDTVNSARRFYHSGETSDVAYVHSALRQRDPSVKWFAIGVSLGGNVLLKWLGEAGETAGLVAAAAISVPFDLEAGARKISRGFARIYDRNFLTTLRRKALLKLARYPDLFDRAELMRARNVFEFDEAVTAPVHGFTSAVDYYRRSSSSGFLTRISVPTLLLSARNDPFLPSQVLDRVASIASTNPKLTLEFVSMGGHVGFVGGPWPWRPIYYAEKRAIAFLREWSARAKGVSLRGS
ncbi:MAG TPA: alpha/beta fold hydrolase [Gemmatimonadaceae bacterium]